MKKWFVLIFLSIILFTTGCSKEQAYIVFNREAITPENILNATYAFEAGERVYYVITIPEYIVTRQLLIQVYKRDNKEGRYGYNLIYGKNIRLSDEQQHYYTDYFVFNDKGIYEFKVYSKDDPTKELASNIVQIR